MRGSKLRAGLDKLAPKAGDAPAAPPLASALASALDLDAGGHRLAEAREIPLGQVHPNPGQPRKSFPAESLEALAASVREQGVLQPITVTPDAEGYRIVAGERRWRAAQIAGLERIPALVRRLSDRDQRIVALMENLQREDLNDIDRARGLADLRDHLAENAPGLRSHELDDEVGKRLGISGRSVRNFLGLLNLSEPVQTAIAEGTLTEKHGRALRRIPEPELQGEVAAAATTHGLTGDETALLVAVVQENPGVNPDRVARMTKTGEMMALVRAAGTMPPTPPAPESPSPAPPTSDTPVTEAALSPPPASAPAAPPSPPSQIPSGPVESSLRRLEEDVRRLEKLLAEAGEGEERAAYGRRLEELAAGILRLSHSLCAPS